MLVIARQRDIAGLKAAGASPGGTSRIFLCASFLTGLVNGGTVKILDSAYYLETIPVVIDGKTVLLIGLLTIVCSILASWLPSRRAGKISPIELLRKF
jgi:lipoprotein-releasing system permease protein